MVKDLIFAIRDREQNVVGTSTELPKASAVYDLSDYLQRPLAVYLRDLKLFDTQTIENMKKAV